MRKADSTSSYQLIQKWKEEEITPGKGAVEPIINVHSWLSRTTLDIIGESEYNVSFLGCFLCLSNHITAGFGFQFGSLDNKKSPLSQAYDGLLCVLPHIALSSWVSDFKTLASRATSIHPPGS